MNKTLLLIICDFLLLNLLALTRWERVEPARPTQAPVPELAANAVTKDQDLVETMRQSLAEKLNTTDANLAAREQSLAAAQVETQKLAASVTESQHNISDLGKRFAVATQEATMTREQLAQLQRELAEKQAEVDKQRQAYEKQLDAQKAEAQNQIGKLTMAVVLAEQQKKDLSEKADSLQQQVV